MTDRPLLVLDIDETLIHGSPQPLPYRCDFMAGNYHIYLRPHVKVFLSTIGDAYDLAVWSAATKGYLDIVVRELMSGIPFQPLFVWDRTRCTRRVDFERQEEFFLKDLKKVKKKGFDLERILILEDEPRKVQKQYGNAVYVKAFIGGLDDEELPLLATYLESIRDTENFRTVEKRNWRADTANRGIANQ